MVDQAETKGNNPLQNPNGFSFIEILLGLVLVSLIFGSFKFFTVNAKDELRFTCEKLEKIIQFASQEAIIRGSIVRLRFSFDKLPQEWILEYGTDGDFVLPNLEKLSNGGSEGQLTLSDQERRDKIIEEINRQFQPIPDFPQGHELLPTNVMVLGLATTVRKDLVNFGDSALYFYPTGEKDAAMLLLGINLGANTQIARIQIQAFLPSVTIDYIPVTGSVEDDKVIFDKSKELHQEWIKG